MNHASTNPRSLDRLLTVRRMRVDVALRALGKARAEVTRREARYREESERLDALHAQRREQQALRNTASGATAAGLLARDRYLERLAALAARQAQIRTAAKGELTAARGKRDEAMMHYQRAQARLEAVTLQQQRLSRAETRRQVLREENEAADNVVNRYATRR